MTSLEFDEETTKVLLLGSTELIFRSGNRKAIDYYLKTGYEVSYSELLDLKQNNLDAFFYVTNTLRPSMLLDYQKGYIRIYQLFEDLTSIPEEHVYMKGYNRVKELLISYLSDTSNSWGPKVYVTAGTAVHFILKDNKCQEFFNDSLDNELYDDDNYYIESHPGVYRFINNLLFKEYEIFGSRDRDYEYREYFLR